MSLIRTHSTLRNTKVTFVLFRISKDLSDSNLAEKVPSKPPSVQSGLKGFVGCDNINNEMNSATFRIYTRRIIGYIKVQPMRGEEED